MGVELIFGRGGGSSSLQPGDIFRGGIVGTVIDDVNAGFSNIIDGDIEGIRRRFGGTSETVSGFVNGPIGEASRIGGGFSSEINISIDNDFSQIQQGLDDILEQMRADIRRETEAPENAFFRNIRIGEQTVSTNIAPILGTLDSLTRGMSGLGDLPVAVATAIMSSIPFGLSLIQAQRLNSLGDSLTGLIDATIGTASSIIDAIANQTSALLNGIKNFIDEGLDKLKELILDPIARLLQAILAAIEAIPGKIATALLEKLLEEAPISPGAT